MELIHKEFKKLLFHVFAHCISIIFKEVFPEDRIVTKDLDATLLDASIVWQSIFVLKELGIRCARNTHIRP